MKFSLKGRWKWGSRRPALAFGAVFAAVLMTFPNLPLPWYLPSEHIKYDTSRPEPAMPGADTDGDGLYDNIEKRVGTSPYNPDTDRDGLSDGEEYRYWMTRYDKESVMNESAKWLKEKYPRESKEQRDERYLPTGDLDGDKLTNIRDPDADGDTLLDGDEVSRGTDPANPDTDGDGIPDDKDRYNTAPGTNPPSNPNQTHPNNPDEPQSSNFTSDTLDPSGFKNASAGEDQILFWVEPAEKPRYWRMSAYETYVNSSWSITSPSRMEYHGDYLPQEVDRPAEVPEDGYRMLFNNETTGYMPNALHTTRIFEGEPQVGIMLDRLSNFYTPQSVHAYKFNTFAMPYTVDDLMTGYFSPDKVHSELTVVPDSVPLRVKALAITITTGANTPMDRVKAILDYLKTNFAFNVTPQEMVPGVDLVDNFLFSSRQGSSLEFASAFVVLCRFNGIPTRFVTGFAIGDIVEGRRAIRAGHFHCWAEVLFANLGWLQFETSTSDYIKSPSKVGADGSDPTVGDLNPQNGTLVIGAGGGGTTQNNTNATQLPVLNATFTIRFDVTPQLIVKGNIFEVKGTLVGPTELGSGANIKVFMNSSVNVVGSGRAGNDGSFLILCSADSLPVGEWKVGINASSVSRNIMYITETPPLTMKKVLLCSNTTLTIESKAAVVRGEYYHYSVHMNDTGRQPPPGDEWVDVLWDGVFKERVLVSAGNDTEEFLVTDAIGPHNMTAIYNGSFYLYPSNVTMTVWVKSGGLKMELGLFPPVPVTGNPMFVDVFLTDEVGAQLSENVTISLDKRELARNLSGAVIKCDLDPKLVGEGKHRLTVRFPGNYMYPELVKEVDVLIKGLSTLILKSASLSVGTKKELTGILRDNLDNPIVGARVNISWLDTMGAERQVNAPTFDDGTFFYTLITYLNTPPGGMLISATFPGTDRFVGSSNTTYIQLTSPSYLNATVPGNITRGDAFCVTGSLLDHLWHPIPKARVVLNLGGYLGGVGWTDDRGDFSIASEVPSVQNAGPTTIELKYAGEGYREAASKSFPVGIYARTGLNLTVPKNLEQGAKFDVVAFLTDDRESPVTRQNVTLYFGGTKYTRATDSYGRAVFKLSFPALSTKEDIKVVYKGGDYKRPSSASMMLTAAPTIVYRSLMVIAVIAVVAAAAYAIRRWGIRREPPPVVLEMLDRSWLRDRYRRTIFKVYTRLLSRMTEFGNPKRDSWTVREFELELQRKMRLDLYSMRLLTLTFEEARYSRHKLSSMDSRRAVASYRKVMESIDVPVRETKVGRIPAAVIDAGLEAEAEKVIPQPGIITEVTPPTPMPATAPGAPVRRPAAPLPQPGTAMRRQAQPPAPLFQRPARPGTAQRAPPPRRPAPPRAPARPPAQPAPARAPAARRPAQTGAGAAPRRPAAATQQQLPRNASAQRPSSGQARPPARRRAVK